MTASGRELSEAIRTGDAGRALALIAGQPALLSARLTGNETPLMLAAARARYGEAWKQLARELLAAGAHLDIFSAIALGNHPAAVAILLETPLRAHRRSPGGWSPLHFAARDGTPELIEALLACGANVNEAHRPSLLTPLFWAGAPANIEVLLAHGADLHHRALRGFTVLHAAAASGDAVRAALLLHHGADPNAQTGARQTPWALAVRAGWRDVARVLAPG